MLQRFKNNPTIDKYFRYALRELICETFYRGKKKPIKRLGSNLFVSGDCAVVVRYATTSELRFLKSRSWQHCYYVIDDDFFSLDQADELPPEYVARLKKFRADSLPQILSVTTDVVAPSERILDHYHDVRTHLLPPCHMGVATDFTHFDKMDGLRLVFAGTRSHRGDLNFLEDVLADVARDRPNVCVTTFFGKDAPASLQGLANVENRKALSWPAFQRMMLSERFHLALAPNLDSTFNNARSFNKILDHAAMGAAGLYSSTPIFQDVISDGENGILIGPDASHWRESIETLLDNPSQMKRMAQGGVDLAKEIGDPDKVRAFWLEKLDLGLT